jgi:hypothetical protein
MPIFKLLIAAVMPALILGCAAMPSQPLAVRDEPVGREVTLGHADSQTSAASTNPALAYSAPSPIQNVGLASTSGRVRCEPILTSLAGTIFEPTSADSSLPIVLTDATTTDPRFGNQVFAPAGPPISAGEATMPGGPTFWISPEEQNGNPPCVVLNDQSLGADIPQSNWQKYGHPIWENLLNDQRNFYSCGSLEWLAGGVGGAAILANTSLDEQFRQFVHGPGGAGSTDLNWMKGFGTGQYVIPSLVGIWAVDYWLDASAPPGSRPYADWLEEWSGRSLRGLIVGAVPLVSLQYITGASRPGESSAGSHWKPFQDNNGVSGHAFVGAVPFWTAAQLTDCVPLQIGFYGMGTLAGISRIHTDSHYLSQVLLGYWLAGLSVAAVDNTEWQKRQWLITPTVFENGGAGMSIMHQW